MDKIFFLDHVINLQIFHNEDDMPKETTEMVSALQMINTQTSDEPMNSWVNTRAFQLQEFFKILLLQNVNKLNFYCLYNYEWLKYTENSFKQTFWVAILNIFSQYSTYHLLHLRWEH